MATKQRIYRIGIVGSYGGCAALAARHDLPPHRLAPAEVQRELLRQGANLRELAPE